MSLFVAELIHKQQWRFCVLTSTISHVQSAHTKVAGKDDIAVANLILPSHPYSSPTIHRHDVSSSLSKVWSGACGGGVFHQIPFSPLSRMECWPTSMMPIVCIGWSTLVGMSFVIGDVFEMIVSSARWWQAVYPGTVQSSMMRVRRERERIPNCMSTVYIAQIE